jgi:hypothetical protein
MASAPRGTTAISIGKGAKGVQIEDVAVDGFGTAIEIHTEATGNQIKNLSTSGGTTPVRYVSDAPDTPSTLTMKENGASRTSSGWNRNLEANWPFPKQRG